MAVLAILIPGLLVFSSGFAGCPSAAGLFIGVRRLPLCWSFHRGSQGKALSKDLIPTPLTVDVED